MIQREITPPSQLTGRYPLWVSAFSFCARPGSGVAFIFLASVPP